MARALAVLVLVLPVVAGAALSASLRLDRARVAVGEAVELTVDVEGGQDVPAPALAAPDGLRIDYRGQSTQVSIVNGRMAASIAHTFTVVPLRPGTYTIGPVTVQAGGRAVEAGSARLVAVAGPAGGGASGAGEVGDGLRLVASVPRTRLYLHERLPVTIALEVQGVRVSDLQYPTIDADGVTVAEFAEPTQRREQRAGGAVDVVEFQTEIVPVRSGTLMLGPATMGLNLVLRGRGDPFFGAFFDRRRATTLRAEPIVLEVLPLPGAGRPPAFSGAVGQFALAVRASPTTLDAGDPVTVDIRISGAGTLAQMAPPGLAAVPGLKRYDPAEAEPPSRAGARVTRHFEQVVIPEVAGTLALPPVEFSFFDPEAEAYRTVRGPAIELTVRPRADDRPDVVVGAATPTREPTATEELGRDIVFIKDDPGVLRPLGSGLHRRPAFWFAQLLPLVVWGLALGWDRRRMRLGADPRLARFLAAGPQARRALAAARRSGEADAVARALHAYLAAKLDLAVGGVTSEAVRRRLEDAGVPAAVIDQVSGVLDACEHERYRPTAGPGADGLHARAARLVTTLERRRRLRLPAAMAIVVAAAGGAWAATEAPKTLFFRGNALYAEGRPAEAAAAWETIRGMGLESGPLHYNLGNAYLRLGRRGEAVLAYERAWRLMPGDPDLAANLRFAREEGDPTEGMSILARIAVPLAGRMATEGLVWWAAVAYWLLAAALIVQRLRPSGRRLARHAAVGAALALLVFGSAAGLRALRVDAPAWAVMLEDGPVRFEPSDAGTVHYDAPVATVVEVLAERPGWLQVARRRDGLRGWIEATRVERL